MPSVCQTIYQYASSTLATSTTYCADPLKFGTLVLEGVLIFVLLLGFGFWIAYKRAN